MKDRSHKATSVDVVVVKEVADFVVPTVSDVDVTVTVAEVVAMAVVVVALPKLAGCVFEVVVGGSKVARHVRVGPELGALTGSSHRLQHFLPLHVPNHRHSLHLQVHLHRVHPFTTTNTTLFNSFNVYLILLNNYFLLQNTLDYLSACKLHA